MQPCGDGHCVAVYFFCDGKNDCGDWTDEMNCTGTVSISVYNALRPYHDFMYNICYAQALQTSTMSCPPNTFHCEGQSCIPRNWVCDGMADCSDGKDELHCNTTSVSELIVY